MANYQPVQNQPIPDSAPPKVVDVLAKILQRRTSQHIPPRPYDAAHWWVDHQEPPNEHTERVERVTDKNGKTAWKTPYIDRVAMTLKVFLDLGEPQKAFVIEKIEQGTPWRGDDMKMFIKICEASKEMAKDRNGYICAALSALKKFAMRKVA